MADLLVPGSTGPEVTELQQKLVGMGYFVGNIDGVFGNKTAAAVAYLQSCHGLDIDAIVGPQVRELLDIGGTISIGITAEWPTVDVWHPGDELVVRLQSMGGAFAHVEVRVVMQFRSPAGQDHAVEQVTVNEGATTMARLQLPASIAGTQGEVHWTGWVFDMQGTQLPDEGAGSFRVDLPDRV
jgi:peptidoglycan hydrolase-like protein with peptidoglycan-binding domain